jgi:hypothetical protein
VPSSITPVVVTFALANVCSTPLCLPVAFIYYTDILSVHTPSIRSLLISLLSWKRYCISRSNFYNIYRVNWFIFLLLLKSMTSERRHTPANNSP